MLSYLRLELRVRPSAPGAEGALSAPLLRRVLGLAFVERFCPFGEPLCQASLPGGGAPRPPQELCHLAACCPYGVLFAASGTRRPPFALFVPPARDGGEESSLEVTLYGPACAQYAWVLGAFAEALQRGLGKERVPWSLREVWTIAPGAARERLCGPGLAGLPAHLAAHQIELASPTYIAPVPVEVQLRSPCRLLRRGKLVKGREPVPFEVLLARILDRFQDLFGEAAGEVLDPRLRAQLETEATRVPLLVEETHWQEVKDYSARSGAEMLLGGKVGRLVYGPEAARFFPILRAGEILQVGKNPTSGCGRIEVRLGGRV